MTSVRGLATVAVALLVTAGCANSDFITQARAEGITVHHADLARTTVMDICASLDDGPDPMSALFRVGFQHMHDPTLSTDDERLVQLGIESQCSQHAEALAGLRAAFTTPEDPPAPPAPVVLSFGQEHTFPDGVSIEVAAPVAYERTEDDLYNGMCESDCPTTGARVRVTITNGSQAAIDPAGTWGNATLNGQPLTALAFAPAPEGELVSSGGAALLPGQSQTFDELFWITEPGDLVIEYHHPDLNGDPISFRGQAGGELVDAAEETATSVVEPDPVPEATHEYPDYSCDMGADGTPICEGDVPESVGEYETPDSIPAFEECLAQAEESETGYPSQECQDLYADQVE